MLQQESPQDFVIATGEYHTVQEFVEQAFSSQGMDWREHVRFDERYLRPLEVDHLCGDASKARKQLGWEPRTSLRNMVRIMVETDLRVEGLASAKEKTSSSIQGVI